MKCYEYEGKRIFSRYNIPIPEGKVVKDEQEAISFINRINKPCVVKAQVLSGKRGKAGGIKFAEDSMEIKEKMRDLKGMKIYGETVENILIEEKLSIKNEFYLGITIDPLKMAPMLIFSTEGGMDIEEIAEKYPEKIMKYELNSNMKYYDFYNMLMNSDFDNTFLVQIVKIMNNLTDLFYNVDATTVEINPLIINEEGRLIAADSKLVIDDSALFRQKNLNLEIKSEGSSPLVKRAEKANLSYVPLDDFGYIGSIAGGAGLAMATMDTIRYCGGKPANFLDIGGGASEEKMSEAVKIVASKAGVKGIIINVFGGINNCEFMARGIERAVKEDKIKVNIVVKMRGHFQEIGWKVLEDINIPIVKYGTTEEAVRMLLENLERGI